VIPCENECPVPAGAKLGLVPVPRHAWGDVLVCPFGCERAFLVLAEPAVPDARPEGRKATTALHPTPTRLADLAAAGRQELFRLPSDGEIRLYYSDGTYRTVTARVGELILVRWLRIGAELPADPPRARWRYLELTAAGRAVLADAAHLTTPGGRLITNG
jgi:hypothetical protein